ncbi:CPBP family intramembrane glutamic endopeptidase [Rhodococcus sp. 3.70]
MTTPAVRSRSTPITAVRSRYQLMRDAWYRLIPARTQIRFLSTVLLGYAIYNAAYAVDDPTRENLKDAFLSWLFWLVFALVPPIAKAKAGGRWPCIRSLTRSLRVTWLRSIRWLGFVMPRPNSQMSAWRRIGLWVLLIPVLVAIGNYLLFEYGVNLDTWFPVTDPDTIAANEARKEFLIRGGIFTAVTGSFLHAALPEEILHRSGVLAVQRWKPSNWKLILSVASVMLVLFALAHLKFGFGNVVSAFIGGALFTVLALYTRSLWPAIAAHGFANLIIEVQWVLNS